MELRRTSRATTDSRAVLAVLECWSVLNNRSGLVKVMIVDDNAEMRTLIRSILSAAGREFVECTGGADAVARFPVERPDWTLMDVVMPEVDGLTATRRIKAQFPDSRILVITQHQNPKLRDAAREAGAAAYLGKEELARIEEILAGTAASSWTPGSKPQ